MQLLNDLVELARATGHDGWHQEGASVFCNGYDVGDTVCYDHICDCEEVNGESVNAAFIAAANPAAILAIAEYVKGLRTLVESEIADFCAGLGSPGEPESPEEMQRQLMERVAAVFDAEAPDDK